MTKTSSFSVECIPSIDYALLLWMVRKVVITIILFSTLVAVHNHFCILSWPYINARISQGFNFFSMVQVKMIWRRSNMPYYWLLLLINLYILWHEHFSLKNKDENKVISCLCITNNILQNEVYIELIKQKRLSMRVSTKT